MIDRIDELLEEILRLSLEKKGRHLPEILDQLIEKERET